ncbi:site-specific DNA-methyltransferase, partial [Anaerolineae bacterium CFX9]|nr:site-specific DNA-methyltransferase [Anaerolineae bacterium CFX9]
LYLNWTEKELPERERTKHVHRLHPYLGKYIPQLVEIFLRKYFRPGDTVLDPFAGSGTTLVQANELGIHAIGYDISAFNVILMKAKTGRYDLSQVEDEIRDILARTESASRRTERQLALFEPAPQPPPETSSLYLREWFAPQALDELLTFRALIKDYAYQDLLKVILSRAARSARLVTHFDLDFPRKPQTEPYFCHKHRRICQPTTSALQFIRRYSLDTITRIRTFSQLRTDARVEIHHGNSAAVSVPSIDGVITSPPYVGLIDYHEQHRYAYELLELEDRRSEEIGAGAGGTAKKARAEYQAGIISVFNNICRSMKAGGRFIVVAGDSHDLYGDIAAALDVEVEAVVQRHVNRRTGRRSSEFYESVFIWRKK